MELDLQSLLGLHVYSCTHRLGHRKPETTSLCNPPGFRTVLRIRIHRIHMFLGLPDPDPLVRGMDPDPSIIMLK
jgi:hypothetical protein